jgi:hypothetical protein
LPILRPSGIVTPDFLEWAAIASYSRGSV